MDDRIHAYEIRGVAGRGAMGTVYEAWDPGANRRVAIKTLSLASVDSEDIAQQLVRFERESEIVRNMHHPNIVEVYDAGRTDKDAYLVMEFLDGQSLKEVLDAGTRFTISNVLWLMGGLLAALGYSHSRGVVHRDIKPANIMITREGVVKVTDFGVARIEGSNMTQAGMMIGTPAYMSPEQFLAEPVDGRSDIYSAGTVLFQLLTGEKAFEGSLTSITYKVLHSQVPKPSAISIQTPRAVDAVVLRAMARNPNERFTTTESFLASLNQALTNPSPEPDLVTNTVVMDRDRTVMAPQSYSARRAAFANIPAHPSSIGPAAIEDSQSTSKLGSLIRFLVYLGILAVLCVIGYDLFLGVAIGTLPNAAGLRHLAETLSRI